MPQHLCNDTIMQRHHETLLTPRELGRLLKLSEETLAHWRCQGKGPGFIKLGAVIRYPRQSVEDFICEAKERGGR